MRTLAVLSTLPLLLGALSAQCIVTTGGVAAGLVAVGADPAHDEGVSPPIDMLFGAGGFPMAGAAGPLTHAVIDSNGVLYLTSGGAAVDRVLYGAFSVASLRGVAGASPRVFPGWSDLEGPAAGWAVNVDTSVPGRFKVNWLDVEEYFSGGPQYSFSASLFDTGVIELSYGNMVTGLTAFAGVSIGNAVGTGLETSVDLTTGPDSGSLGLLFQLFNFAVQPSVTDRTVMLVPNGSGGYMTIVTCKPATHEVFGTGCHDLARETFYEFYADAAIASAALQGNAMLLTPGANGYSAVWIPSAAAALYVAPTGAATSLPVTDDGSTLVTPSVPLTIPGGSAASLTVGHNGIVTVGTVANNAGDFTVTGPEVASALGAAFYSFSDFRDTNTTPVPSGTIKTEEVAGIYYVTWDAVDHWTNPQVSSPSTLQFQFDLASGVVTYVWLTIDTNTTSLDGSAYLVGYTGPGAGIDPGSIPLATALPVTTAPDVKAMTLSAAPAPVINPSTLVTYTAIDLPEFVPGSGVYLSTMFLSVNPNPFGFDLNGILTTVPGCNAWIVTLDLDLGAQLTFAPTAMWSFTFDNVFFAPGNVIGAQAVALFDSAFPLPNGESGGFLFTNGVRSTTQPN